MRSIVSLVMLGLILSILPACQSDVPATKVRRTGNTTLSPTTAVVDHFPYEMDDEVPMTSTIAVKFSAPIDIRSLDFFTFRIEDELGNPLIGTITWNAERDQINFVRTINGQAIALDPGVNYRVYTEYLRDENNYLIAPYSYEFRTEEFATNASGGEFAVEKIKPESYIIFPNNKIDIKFSRPVYPNLPNYCSTMWNDAIQIFGLSFAGGNISVPSIGGQVCLRCPPPSNICNTLSFVPSGGWPEFSPWLLIEVRPTPELRSIDGYTLDGDYEVEKGVLFSFF